MRVLAAILISAAAIQINCQAPSPESVSIQVDLTRPVGSFKPICSWFGYDESNYTTTERGKQLLSELHDLSPAPVSIRAHHLLTSGNGVPELKWSSSNVFRLDEKGKPIYDFTVTDQIFDEFQKAGVRPMVELGFMPRDLAAPVEGITEYQLHFPKPTMGGASNNPPKDYGMWGELVRKYTEHLVERYGRQQVSAWYFEVWNEPDIIYWHGTPEEYFKLYDYAVAGVRAALPNAKVGGPATTGPSGAKAGAFLDKFLQHCLHDRSAADGKPIPLDFISFHPKGRTALVDGHVEMGLANELQAADAGFRIVAKYPQFRHLPIILSEADPEGCAACSIKDNPANAYRNGTLYASYTATAMKALFELQDETKVNLAAMLTWAFEFENRDYFEGFRTLATNGIDKPILNLFRMAGLMAGERVATTSTGRVPLGDLVKTGVREAPDVDAIATRAEGEAAVMIWNYHDDDRPAPDAEVQISVTGIPAGVGRVLLEHYRIDDTHSNAYTAWKAMGSPQSPTPDQVARLEAAGQLEQLTSPQWLDVRNGKATIDTQLPRQAVSLLRLKW
ncbi:MAG: beta-xylosidase [Terracidiphilus sp.]|jgi:xylan 1,4-beta-xylosidase